MKVLIKMTVIFISLILSLNIISAQAFYLTDLKCTGGMPNTIYFDNNTETLYAGCWGGVWKYNGSPGNWTEVDSDPEHAILANAKITALFIDSKGVFYAGCDDRTQSYISYDGGKKWEQINDFNFTGQRIYCITEGIDGSVYVGTGTGIIKTSDNGRTWKKLKGISAGINCFFVNSSGKIFVGVYNGINCTTSNDSSWTQVSLPGLIRAVYSIEDDSNKKIYAGANGEMYASDNEGLSWYSIKSSFTGTPLQNNLVINSITIPSSNKIYIVAGFGSQCWRSTENIQSWQIMTCSPPDFNNPNWSNVICDSKDNFYGLSTRYGMMKIEEITVDVFDKEEIITNYTLKQNYPNPFNPGTVISYQVAVGSHAQIKVYDLLGREVAKLVDEYKPTGIYTETFHGTSLPSGIYFYTLKAGDYIATKKMILMK